MAYGLELREKVLQFLAKGHSQTEACEVFDVCRKTIYNWLNREYLAPVLNHTKGYKIDKKEFKKFVDNNPSVFERELAEKFNVSQSAISQMLKKLGYSNKKKSLDITKQTIKK